MSKANILVVEDESIVSKDIQLSLKKLGYNVIGSATTGAKAIEMALELQPDIILMDIMLKGDINGIRATKRIQTRANIPVIYLTAYADENTLERAKVTQPYGYIIKPFKEIDLQTSIEMALYKHKKQLEILDDRDRLYSIVNNESVDYIFVKNNTQLIKLKAEDVLYIEALKDYVNIVTIEKKYMIHSTMKAINEKMPSRDYVRIHRSYIVRMEKINKIDHADLYMEGVDKAFPIGGSYRADLLRKINLI
ncbi:MAG: response regulator [Flavobacteriales bacterium]|jgi:DNA-binding LytR/AlgR family response regulator|nr:response regulator [Flavobacteriales bacterium]